MKFSWCLQKFDCIIVGQDISFSQTCPRGVARLTHWQSKFGHRDLISLTEVYPLSYRDIRRGLLGLVPPYCSLLEYEGFTDNNSHSKIVLFSKMGPYEPRSPLLKLPNKLRNEIKCEALLGLFTSFSQRV